MVMVRSDGPVLARDARTDVRVHNGQSIDDKFCHSGKCDRKIIQQRNYVSYDQPRPDIGSTLATQTEERHNSRARHFCHHWPMAEKVLHFF